MDILKRIHRLAEEIDPDITIQGRVKTVESIREKMARNNLALNEVMDVIGIRAITGRTDDCYQIRDVLHDEFTVLHDEYDDYIARPKPNGYSSIHTTLITPAGTPVEVQIRTRLMHEICETGSAAHWRYKGGTGASWHTRCNGHSMRHDLHDLRGGHE